MMGVPRKASGMLEGACLCISIPCETMITCYLKYEIDPWKLAEFEQYVRMWFPLLKKFGGTHHGYFLPSEGASNIALGLFSFPSMADYEQYREKSLQDPECQAAFRFARETRCFLSYERSFFRPLLDEGVAPHA